MSLSRRSVIRCKEVLALELHMGQIRQRGPRRTYALGSEATMSPSGDVSDHKVDTHEEAVPGFHSEAPKVAIM